MQITLGSGGAGHDGVVCTTEGVSTPDRAEIPLNACDNAVAEAGSSPPLRDAIARVRVMALRVVFAEDNYLVRQGVTSLLTEVEDIDVVAVATDLASLLESVAGASPDVVLTDIRMPPTHTNEGIEAARQIRSRHPGVGVVVLSQYVEEDYVFELLADGVAGLGYLLKERVTDLDELVRALREVARGGSVLDPVVVETLIARRREHGPLLGPD